VNEKILFAVRFSLIQTPGTAAITDQGGNVFSSALLGPLSNHGGPTFTHEPLVGSPAINAGDPSAMEGVNRVPFFDPRGAPFIRVADGRIDMGAFESQAAVDAAFNNGGPALSRNARGRRNIIPEAFKLTFSFIDAAS
jgi:hypothetical protein